MTALARLRKSKKLRLRQVAEAIGVTPQTVWKHEKCGIKTFRIAKNYAAFFRCSPFDLIDL
ncbi:helix-turn-helix domain-containing protein [Victivallis vadensis]|jgi:DNA-binding helix-turn-helix protein|uniref:Helix-turn-helix transcriptional regulator n=1 Tax=Victivallis vadensis TaxID=172901 RepID=A0A848AUY4_9BACT|nr:helix-turn-helix transcriptional regulator [Victivallis vadensis]NMD85917.1 helix-turn-helix transcriptional regulator [Victivallis vadensis]HJH03626.1 helix-turn-helix domain-containing protein [Victivallis vadensis]